MKSQQTLATEVVFEGVGIHTGKHCRLVVKPAEVHHGRVFQAPCGTRIPARVDHVVNCDRSTILGVGEARVHTPEHLLSAMSALSIDNALIEMSGPEIPILDGSAKQFFTALQAADVVQQDAPARTLCPEKPFLATGDAGQCVLVLPADSLIFEYVLHYEHPMLGCQTVVFEPAKDSYRDRIAEARTFALWEEVKPLLDRGMALGGTLENALVVYQDKYSSELKMDKEPVCHKCLDLIGDFALLDARIRAKVIAVKAGHKLHVQAATMVWEEMNVCERA